MVRMRAERGPLVSIPPAIAEAAAQVHAPVASPPAALGSFTAPPRWEGRTYVHPTALVDPRAELEEGVWVGPYCIIESHTRIGTGFYDVFSTPVSSARHRYIARYER